MASNESINSTKAQISYDIQHNHRLLATQIEDLLRILEKYEDNMLSSQDVLYIRTLIEKYEKKNKARFGS